MLRARDPVPSINITLITMTDLELLSSYSCDKTNVCTNDLGNKLSKWVYNFISKRFPSILIDVLSGTHWIWLSVRKKLKLIAMIMIMSEHVISKIDLEYMNNIYILLEHRHTFLAA